MRYFMINPYMDIPKYAEIKIIGHCYDSGYSCYEVEYMGHTYKPFDRDVKSENEIVNDFTSSLEEFEKARLVYNKTICSGF